MITLPARQPLQAPPSNFFDAFPDGSLNVVIHKRSEASRRPNYKLCLKDPSGSVLFEDGIRHVFERGVEQGEIHAHFIMDAALEPLPAGMLQLEVLVDKELKKFWINVARSGFLLPYQDSSDMDPLIARGEMDIPLGAAELMVSYHPARGAAPKTITLGSYDRDSGIGPVTDLNLTVLSSDRYGFVVGIDPPLAVGNVVLTWAVW